MQLEKRERTNRSFFFFFLISGALNTKVAVTAKTKMASSRCHYHIKSCTCSQPSISEPWKKKRTSAMTQGRLNRCVSDFLTWATVINESGRRGEQGFIKTRTCATTPLSSFYYGLFIVSGSFLTVFFFRLVISWQIESGGWVDSYKHHNRVWFVYRCLLKDESVRTHDLDSESRFLSEFQLNFREHIIWC